MTLMSQSLLAEKTVARTAVAIGHSVTQPLLSAKNRGNV